MSDMDPEVEKWLRRLESAQHYIAHTPFLGVQAMAIGFTAAAWAANEKYGSEFPEPLAEFFTDAENFTNDFIGDDD